MKIGENRLFIDKNTMTYDQATEKCRELDSALVEIWTEEEWKEVNNLKIVLKYNKYY